MGQIPQTEPGTPYLSGQKLLAFVTRLEEALLTTLLTVMILLACYQIALRWSTSGGLVWIDPLLRYLVLWSGLLGAALATAKGNHIAIDVVSHLVHNRLKPWLKLAINCFSTIVSAFLFRAALLFIQNEIEYGGSGLFGLHSWIWNLIFPIAFGLICLHFAITSLLAVKDLFCPKNHIVTGCNNP